MNAIDLLPVIAPELANADNAETFIELASGRCSPRVFGARHQEAVAYLAAHLMTVSLRALTDGVASAGPVTSVRTGGLAVSFGQVASNGNPADEAFKTTSYGLEYLAIRNSRPLTKGMLLR